MEILCLLLSCVDVDILDIVGQSQLLYNLVPGTIPVRISCMRGEWRVGGVGQSSGGPCHVMLGLG